MLFQEVDSISSVVQSCLKHCYDRTGAEFLFSFFFLQNSLLDMPSCGEEIRLWIPRLCSRVHIEYWIFSIRAILWNLSYIWTIFQYVWHLFKSVLLAKHTSLQHSSSSISAKRKPPKSYHQFHHGEVKNDFFCCYSSITNKCKPLPFSSL